VTVECVARLSVPSTAEGFSLVPPDAPESQDYLVLTGDVVRSRQVDDREALRQTLLSVLDAVNGDEAEAILVPLSITAGDEFQGVFRVDGRIVKVVDRLERGLFPVRVRVGIGIGPIHTAFTARSQEMDGPAFVRAREALEATRKFRPDAWLQFRTADETFDLPANAMALLLGLVKARWSALHWRRAALRDEGLHVADIAELEGVVQSTVTESLQAAEFGAVRNAEESLAELIDRTWNIGF